MQHELFPRIAVTGGYYRRQFYNSQFTSAWEETSTAPALIPAR